jgi:hypothetical protein
MFAAHSALVRVPSSHHRFSSEARRCTLGERSDGDWRRLKTVPLCLYPIGFNLVSSVPDAQGDVTYVAKCWDIEAVVNWSIIITRIIRSAKPR